MPRPALLLLGAGGLVTLAAIALLVAIVRRYLDNPSAISSTSGLVVFRTPDGYVAYFPFDPGIAPFLALVGIAIMVGALFVAAMTWRPQSSWASRASTASRKAEAQIR